MLAVQKNKLLVRALLHLSTRDAPPTESVVVALTSHVGATLVLSEVTPLAHATPSLLLPFSSYPSAFARFACHTATFSFQ